VHDVTKEQHYINEVFDAFADAAARVGVTVVPAMADDGSQATSSVTWQGERRDSGRDVGRSLVPRWRLQPRDSAVTPS
jgi:hypothetical protein